MAGRTFLRKNTTTFCHCIHLHFASNIKSHAPTIEHPKFHSSRNIHLYRESHTFFLFIAFHAFLDLLRQPNIFRAMKNYTKDLCILTVLVERRVFSSSNYALLKIKGGNTPSLVRNSHNISVRIPGC